MESLKYFHVKRILIILLLAVNGNLSAATDCNNHHEMASVPLSQYNTTYKLILSSNPTVQIQVVKIQPKNYVENSAGKTIYVLKQKPKFNGNYDDVSKENALKSIINTLKDKTPITNNYVIPPVQMSPMVFNPWPTNHYNPPNQNVNNHFVYNIQNHGIHHHHYYGSPSGNENIQTNFMPLKNVNRNKTTAWINNVPAQK